jgi:hypothetical protein
LNAVLIFKIKKKVVVANESKVIIVPNDSIPVLPVPHVFVSMA